MTKCFRPSMLLKTYTLLILLQIAFCFETKSLDNYEKEDLIASQSIRNTQAQGGVSLIYTVEGKGECTPFLDELSTDGNIICEYTVEPKDRPVSVFLFAQDCVGSPPAAVTMLFDDNNGDVEAIFNIERSVLASTSNTIDQTLVFCIRVDVSEDFGGTLHSMNYQLTEITVNFLPNGEFTMDAAIGESPKLKPLSAMIFYEKKYVVDAYQCNKDTRVKITSPLFSGETAGICIFAPDPTAKITSVIEVGFFQNQEDTGAGIIKNLPVTDKEPNQVSTWDCTVPPTGSQTWKSGNMCLVETEMLTKFFEDENAPLFCVGEVDLDIRTERRYDRARMLQERDQNNSPSIDDEGEPIMVRETQHTFSFVLELAKSDIPNRLGGYKDETWESRHNSHALFPNQVWSYLTIILNALFLICI